MHALSERNSWAFIQDAHLIKDIMKSQGIPDFQAPPPIPKFIDAQEAIEELRDWRGYTRQKRGN